MVFEASDAFKEHKSLRKGLRKWKARFRNDMSHPNPELDRHHFDRFLRELLGPMSEEAFYAALRQFMARLDSVVNPSRSGSRRSSRFLCYGAR